MWQNMKRHQLIHQHSIIIIHIINIAYRIIISGNSNQGFEVISGHYLAPWWSITFWKNKAYTVFASYACVWFMYILVLSQNALAVWLICSIIFRILRGTNMKPFIFSACNMRIHYGYITIRRKFREKKIDSVVRWIFWWITFYNVQKKQNARQKVGSWWISELNEKSKYDDEEVHASFTTF